MNRVLQLTFSSGFAEGGFRIGWDDILIGLPFIALAVMVLMFIQRRRNAAGSLVELQREMAARKQAEMVLLHANAELELRVQERTAELAETNTALQHALTARAGSEEQSRQQIERLQKLKAGDDNKDELLAALAHELREPLAPIRNAVQALQLIGPADERIQWARALIDRQVQCMSRIVDDLLDLSRISSGKFNLVKESVAIGEAVARAVEMSKPVIEERKHELTVSIPPEPIYVAGDRVRLAQIVLNLLNNAAQHTVNEGRISLTVERSQGEVLIRVYDNGQAVRTQMASADLDEPARREQTPKRVQGGPGMGQTLVLRLVEMHGGALETLSAGEANGFVVRLPVTSEKSPTRAAVEADSGPRRDDLQAARRILVVDDNKDSAESLAKLLRIIGGEVRTAYDGGSALASMKSFAPDAVLLDIGLPDMDGYEVARQIRQRSDAPQPLLIALTGYTADEDKRRSREAGFDHHLAKPVRFNALQTLLESSGHGALIQRERNS